MAPWGRPPSLPDGVEVWQLGITGGVSRTTAAGTARLSDDREPLVRFIDHGQVARYLVGDSHTSPERPCNATYKLGLVRPHSAFTPHAHAGEHWVLSGGYASCGLYDLGRDRVVTLRLRPGSLARIPAMLPHSFGNRSGRPLLVLAANTGYGVDHEDYAITAEIAEQRAGWPVQASVPPAAGHPSASRLQAAHPDVDYARLAPVLRRLASETRPAGRSAGEWAAAGLRRVAEWLEWSPW